MKLSRSLARYGKIIRRTMKRNRRMITLEDSHGRRHTFVNAHHVWLRANPEFDEIPNKYVMHHLDGDELNDDPSNLVIMYQRLHTAFHIKNEKFSDAIEHLDPEEINQGPLGVEPKYYKRKGLKCERHVLYWDVNGRRHTLTTYKGRRLKTVEDCEWAKAQLWQRPKNNKRCSTCHGKGFVFTGELP